MLSHFYCFSAKYWHSLYIDYKAVAIDVAKDCREHPIRATIYTTSMYYFSYIFLFQATFEISIKNDIC